MQQGLTLDTWHGRLQARGHRVSEPNAEPETGFSLWSDADTIVTVAVEPDGALKPPYRQRFFRCEPEPEQIFRVMGGPGLYCSRWLKQVARQPASYWQDFMAGPGSWLLCRLARFETTVVWANQGMPWDGLDCPIHRSWGMDLPTRATDFFAATAGPDALQPRLLPVRDDRFADVVAACLLFASVGLRDCYLADADASEVYQAHHHDKIVISIPPEATREKLVRQLEEVAWLFTDVSGYASSMDDEDVSDAGGDD
jgi:hypothetical protein